MMNSNAFRPEHIPYRIAFGPVAYHSSDENLKAKIEIALSQNCGIDLSHVQIKVFEGDVSISGVVSAEQSLHVTDEIVRCGVHEVENLLRTF